MNIFTSMAEKIKTGIRTWLHIQPAVNGSISIQETLDYEGNAIKNKIWYRGESEELSQLYSQIDGDKTRFWSASCTIGMEIRKIHVGLPAMLCDMLASIVTDDMNLIDAGSRQTEWDKIAEENDFIELVKQAITETLYIGDGAFKISFDTNLSKYPILEFYSGDKTEIIKDRGRVKEIVFKTVYNVQRQEYVLLEHYGIGYIHYELTRGGREYDLSVIPELAHLSDVTWNDKFIMAVPLLFYKSANKKMFSSKFSDINDSIDAMIFAARQEGGTEQEQKILRALKKGLKASKVSQGAEGAFFRLNTRKLNALIKATKSDFSRAEKAMLRMSEDKYRQIIFNAQVYANTGAGTYEKAVDMATKDFLKAGINCIEYANGARHTMKDYAKMAIQTANKRAYLTGEGEMRQSWGISTVIMNKRANACPKCLPFVGKILIDDVWSGGKTSDGPYPLMSSAMAAGLYHPNCKDVHTTYFPELDDEPDSKFSKKEIEQVKEDYKQDQKQQYAGRMVEQFDRLSKYSLDSDNKKMYEVRKEQWENVSKEYERGYIDNNSQRIGTNKIDLDYINSKDYADKYMKISKDMELNNVIYSKSMDILRSNNSSDTEGLCVISVSNRQVLLNVRGKPDAIGVELNKKQMSIINKHKNDIIGIHNHPTNLLPNGSDFVAAGARGYQYGIVVTHDGRIYKYSVGDKPFLPYLLDNRIDKYCSKEYNLNIKEAYEKALNEFRKEYGISWQEIE